MYFAGWSVASVFLSRIPDLHGRKKFFLTAIVFSTLLYLSILFIRNLYVIIGIFFLIGLGTIGRKAVCYIYLMEFVPKKH